MTKIITGAVCMVTIEAMSRLFNGDIAWYFAQWSQMLMCLVWTSILFSVVPKHKINARSALGVVVISYIIDVAAYPAWILYPDSYIYACVGYVALMYAALWHVTNRTYKYSSDRIENNNIYICLWRPEKAGSVFKSLIGAPIGSVCIYADGHMHAFKWGKKEYIKKEVRPEVVQRKFIIIDSGVAVTEELNSELEKLLGAKARAWKSLWVRCRCIVIIKPLLVKMGEGFKPRLLEFIPSLYAARLLRSRGNDER